MLSAGSRQPRLTAGLFFHAVLPPVLRYLTVTDSFSKTFSDITEPQAYLETSYLNIKKQHEAELKSLASKHDLLLFNAVKHDLKQFLHSKGVYVSYAETAEFMVQHWDFMFPGSPKLGA